MKQNIGFRPTSKSQKEETPYDAYLGKFVRLDVAGGIGGSGVLLDSKRLEHGYAFSLNPAIFYENQIPQIINEPVLITSNGSPVSFYPVPKSIENFVEENHPKEEPSNITIYSK